MNKQELRTNKQELISKYELIKNSFNFDTVATDGIISDLNRLDEPEKVTIPQYIADKIEHCKESGDWDLFQAMDYCFNFRECSSWLEFKNNQETFALAWILGYEVEKEKRYLVKIKNMSKKMDCLAFKFGHIWVFRSSEENEEYRTRHTRKELEEADFGWVFDCEGIEIDEVE